METGDKGGWRRRSMLSPDNLALIRLHVERGCSCVSTVGTELLPHIDALTAERDAATARATAAEAENAALRHFLDVDLMPRYVELFEAAGLGDPSDSVVVQGATSLLATPPTGHGAAVLAAARAFVAHHDAGQAPNQPKTYADCDVWHAEWVRRLDALREALGTVGGAEG